jgi:hypothetical protein
MRLSADTRFVGMEAAMADVNWPSIIINDGIRAKELTKDGVSWVNHTSLKSLN